MAGCPATRDGGISLFVVERAAMRRLLMWYPEVGPKDGAQGWSPRMRPAPQTGGCRRCGDLGAQPCAISALEINTIDDFDLDAVDKKPRATSSSPAGRWCRAHAFLCSGGELVE
jgi:hypothetical protein